MDEKRVIELSIIANRVRKNALTALNPVIREVRSLSLMYLRFFTLR